MKTPTTPHSKHPHHRVGTAPENGQPPATLPHFEHISRYWDNEHRCFAARLLPGEYYVTTMHEIVTTMLGSCVSACIRDTRIGVGGMNHFMLPLDASQGTRSWGEATSAATRYGGVAMERLINDILRHGGRRQNLEIKLVGGGRVLAAMTTDIGARNIEFVRKYVKDEGLKVVGEDLGDIYPRKVVYFPNTGKIRVKRFLAAKDHSIEDRERNYLNELDSKSMGGDVELF